MEFTRVDQAIRALENVSVDPVTRDEATQFLLNLDDQEEIKQLIDALQNDDFGIRWEASHLLAQMGDRAYPHLLETLVDPKLVGNFRIREGIYHILHNNYDPQVKAESIPLQHAIKGPAADLNTMKEAHHLLLNLRLKKYQNLTQ